MAVVSLLPNMIIELVLGRRSVRTRVLRCLGQDVYLEALADIESELTPMPGQTFQIVWSADDMRWGQFARMVNVLETLPIMRVNLEGKPFPMEQRAVPRVRVTVPVEYGIPRRERYLTTTLDLSIAGLRFPSAIPLWPDLSLTLGLRLGNELLNVKATVIRVDKRPRDFRGRLGWETAVRFVGMAYEDRSTLERFVKEHLRAAENRRRSSSGKMP